MTGTEDPSVVASTQAERGPDVGPSCRLCRGGAVLTAVFGVLLSAIPAAAQALAGDPTGLAGAEGEANGVLDEVVAAALGAPELPVMAAGLIDTIGGRLSGTPAGTRAEAWAAGWLRSFGFDSVWYDIARVPVWRRGELDVRVIAPGALSQRRIVAVAYGYSPGIAADSVPLLDVGRGDPVEIEAAGRAADGAALLTDGVVTPAVLEAARSAGAAAILRISFEPGRLPQARVAPVEEPPAPLPLVSVSHEDGRWLRRQAATGPLLLGLRVETETRLATVANVVGEWRGDDPEVGGEVVLLGAHLDAWDLGDGALDNGTGVLAVMTAARALTAVGTRPRRTVHVVLFAAEELGLLGSRSYVRDHASGIANVVAMMNLDMVGAPQSYGATGHAEGDTLFARLTRTPGLRELEISAEVNHGGGAGSDHQPFLLAGVPTIYVQTSLPEEAPSWYHNAADTMDKIDLEAVRGTGAAAAAAIWALADHPGRPLRHLTREETRALVQRLGW